MQIFVCLDFGQGVCEYFFCLRPHHKNNMEEKTYPGMDSLVCGKADGANFISV